MNISAVGGNPQLAIAAATRGLQAAQAQPPVAAAPAEREGDSDGDDRVQSRDPAKGQSVDVNA